MKYCIYFPLLCLYMCGFTWVSHFPYVSLSFGEGKEDWSVLSSNTDLHRQAGPTPWWRSASLHYLFVWHLHFNLLYIFISPCENVKSSVCLSPPALSAFFSSIWASITPFLFCLLSNHLCLCVCCRPSPSHTQLRQAALNFYHLHQPGCCLILSNPPYWLQPGVFSLFYFCLSPEGKSILSTRNVQLWTKWKYRSFCLQNAIYIYI